jgi:hypothetical protein
VKQGNMYRNNMLRKGCMSKGCVCPTVRCLVMLAYEGSCQAIFINVMTS